MTIALTRHLTPTKKGTQLFAYGKPVKSCGPFLLLIGTLFLANGHPVAAAPEGDARDLVKRVMEALPRVPFTSTLTLTTAQGVRQFALHHKFIDGARDSYLELTAPEELKGIRFLFLERVNAPADQYMKLATSKTLMRVADEVRTQPFLGSTFYIADLVTPPLDNFTYKLVGEEQILGRRALLVEAAPKDPKKEIYGKTIMGLDPQDLLVLRRQFYDHDGQILKVWTVESIEKVDGIWTMTKQRMTNTQANEQSRLEVQAIKYNVELPDAMFTPKYLLH